MCFGFMGCPEQTGDLSKLVDYMHEALAETLAAAEAEAAKTGTRVHADPQAAAPQPGRQRCPAHRGAVTVGPGGLSTLPGERHTVAAARD